MKSYVVAGKVRLQIFIPTPSADNFAAAAETEPVSGPAVVEEPANRDECYTEDGQPDECATEQEIEDTDILAAEVEYETSALDAELTEMCSQRPSFCNQDTDDDELVPASGPCADGDGLGTGCAQYAFACTMALAGSFSNLLRYAGARAAAGGAALGAMTVASYYIAIGAAGFAVGYSGAAFFDCYFS